MLPQDSLQTNRALCWIALAAPYGGDAVLSSRPSELSPWAVGIFWTAAPRVQHQRVNRVGTNSVSFSFAVPFLQDTCLWRNRVEEAPNGGEFPSPTADVRQETRSFRSFSFMLLHSPDRCFSFAPGPCPKASSCRLVTQGGMANSDGPSGTVRRWTSFRSFYAPLRAQAALLPCGRAGLQRARHAFKPRSSQKKALLTSCALRFTTPLIRLCPIACELIPRLRKRPSSGNNEASILACIFPPA